jgi:hypothetical protein
VKRLAELTSVYPYVFAESQKSVIYRIADLISFPPPVTKTLCLQLKAISESKLHERKETVFS